MSHPSLCHPDELKSCGACCGLYNYRANSRAVLTERLRRRSEIFSRYRGEPDQYRCAVAHLEEAKLYETIYNCEFLGFIDKHEQRVGCLLHPNGNNGRDLRRISFYGADLCREHLCPSHEKLTTAEKAVVMRLVNDWYLYGLLITDIDLVKSYLGHIQNGVGEEFDPHKLNTNSALALGMQSFFSWKEQWPYRRNEALRFGKYYFVEAEYHIAQIEYDRLGLKPSLYDAIFLSLASEFEKKDEVSAAEKMVRENIDKVITLYGTG
jgi:hypothetical protein